ncbi:hypothetical protein BGZ60DRAFT_546641 [Tricladium varicosporioides]|nr:hypothetical protein BGZ60DRAFT_546641 [Hymenoscyphus varicosporioides]
MSCLGWVLRVLMEKKLIHDTVLLFLTCAVTAQPLFLEKTFWSGEQAAFRADIIELLDALSIHKAIFAGYSWRGRGVCIAAAI